ncbi:DUF2956 domain-containing protein [Methylicorpusculum oleiharenae]|uniref:DUF2956 domain-containing protein n=1 Tax=Methylicorpusculum oleiharenae TaxID=1338687 RepID=UPI001359238D|nr:DUF2956 domain-containing protein [Methylicorpusculum oleiharenae]MCD2449481.1 DUF2956 domain-containing protein [Methylicorpusculum oleiharenae]
MTAKSKYDQPSEESREQALQIAKAIQRPGQTKEQTKLVSLGIQKGIEVYKKQQKAKARELDKKRKKPSSVSSDKFDKNSNTSTPIVIYKQSPLPWVLLGVSWLAVLLFYLAGNK